VLSNRDLGTSDLSKNSDRESRSGERVSHDEVLGDLEESSECSYFVCSRRKEIRTLVNGRE
jgi:hypothetical protein